ncbi:MAG: type II glyceraldehyde-3-phosphate dehydrogenase [Thermoplasmata archaeon]|nr:MAG: type II glyceraldehyde-3-phosphate dehydrogenase [Thermoplasmata archaeon]
MVVKVAINGYGTIGRRVADAVEAQRDMKVVGVTKTRPTYEAAIAKEKGFKLFASSADKVKDFENAGIDVEGTLDDLLGEADVVVDCTPSKVGATYIDKYKSFGLKVIFQGGEKADVAEVSFNAYANYNKAYGANSVRVVSCNTTGLCRTLYPIHAEIGIESVYAVMVRRAADPADTKRGPINAIEPSLKVPSHHGPDVRTVIEDLNIFTMAVKVPTTVMHLHSIILKPKRDVSAEEILNIWRKSPRIMFVEGKYGVKSTAQVMDVAREIGRPRSDMYEIVVWSDGVHVDGGTVYYYQAVHQESDVIPENVDAIRAVMQIEDDKMKSIETTDRSLGIEVRYA